ncbi:MAG: hypothetical protein KTR25_10785 [Myxococcales bacterium]|nr:hypothetical protein [Myxococcales bacterium]
MGGVIREVSFPWNALDEEGAYRAYATDERRSRSGRSTEKGPAKRLTHFSDGLLGRAFKLRTPFCLVSYVCEGSVASPPFQVPRPGTARTFLPGSIPHAR